MLNHHGIGTMEMHVARGHTPIGTQIHETPLHRGDQSPKVKHLRHWRMKSRWPSPRKQQSPKHPRPLPPPPP
ncbi:hypothetical protein L484_022443 [Morus notabilis]|uniref:Uncharacterized protein n=1 Tax=Morus notabilis TaxID=981085 RepID=W9R2I3_9ROSA|nr:hypothetical protein L484_022443 [Morus notabilis]